MRCWEDAGSRFAEALDCFELAFLMEKTIDPCCFAPPAWQEMQESGRTAQVLRLGSGFLEILRMEKYVCMEYSELYGVAFVAGNRANGTSAVVPNRICMDDRLLAGEDPQAVLREVIRLALIVYLQQMCADNRSAGYFSSHRERWRDMPQQEMRADLEAEAGRMAEEILRMINIRRCRRLFEEAAARYVCDMTAKKGEERGGDV